MRWPFTLLLCLLVSACFTTGKRGGDTAMATYDFGPAVPRLLAESRKQALAVEVRAPLWFDSLGIDYRLMYLDAARLREYATARWAGPPAQMIQQRLMQQLDLARAGQGQAACLLRVEITEFSQVFSSPESSKGVLQGRAVFLDRSRRQLAELELNLEQPASSQDAAGGVRAMTANVAQLAIDLRAWEQGLINAGKAAGCSG
ncbi:MAG TPA: ABC-type transport auxiliary lipoprotein family protein [Azonexus sp.]|nr:ABC-type transport auxiliary lipoprotein family protein [Azonexus sp.]